MINLIRPELQGKLVNCGGYFGIVLGDNRKLFIAAARAEVENHNRRSPGLGRRGR